MNDGDDGGKRSDYDKDGDDIDEHIFNRGNND